MRASSRNLMSSTIINCILHLNVSWPLLRHLLLPAALVLVQEQHQSSPRSCCPFRSLLMKMTNSKSFGKRVSVVVTAAS